MNRKLISKALSNIDDTIITETLSPAPKLDRAPERTIQMSRYEDKRNTLRSRRVFSVILAACLVFALAITAYATNFLGIREMLQKSNQELPEDALEYIQEHDETIDSQGWKCEVTESLCDDKNIFITINVSSLSEYILAPTDATPEHNVAVIGLDGEETLGEYAAEQNKKLLFVGASIQDSENLGITASTQTFASSSPQELTIMIHAQKTETGSLGEVTCNVTGTEENAVLTRSLPITLAEAPSDGSIAYIPVDPDVIPGITVGAATVEETPLGIGVRFLETITDEDAFYNIMKIEIDGITYSEGGSVLEDDGNWYYTISCGMGTVGDTLTIHFYNWDKEVIGSVVFERKI